MVSLTFTLLLIASVGAQVYCLRQLYQHAKRAPFITSIRRGRI